jgi:AAA+ superfamily predicted ATPase
MSKRKKYSLDEEARKGAEKLRKLLSNPEEFERWANETFDMSRMRKR